MAAAAAAPAADTKPLGKSARRGRPIAYELLLQPLLEAEGRMWVKRWRRVAKRTEEGKQRTGAGAGARALRDAAVPLLKCLLNSKPVVRCARGEWRGPARVAPPTLVLPGPACLRTHSAQSGRAWGGSCGREGMMCANVWGHRHDWAHC